jgi:hypothetical protein
MQSYWPRMVNHLHLTLWSLLMNDFVNIGCFLLPTFIEWFFHLQTLLKVLTTLTKKINDLFFLPLVLSSVERNPGFCIDIHDNLKLGNSRQLY